MPRRTCPRIKAVAWQKFRICLQSGPTENISIDPDFRLVLLLHACIRPKFVVVCVTHGCGSFSLSYELLWLLLPSLSWKMLTIRRIGPTFIFACQWKKNDVIWYQRFLLSIISFNLFWYLCAHRFEASPCLLLNWKLHKIVSPKIKADQSVALNAHGPPYRAIRPVKSWRDVKFWFRN